MNYNELPGAVLTLVTRHFSVEFESNEIDIMKSAAQFNAKTPQLFFEFDTEQKQGEATDAVHQAAKLVQPFYDKLENIRRDRREAFR